MVMLTKGTKTLENRVTNPSKNPAKTVNGRVLTQILKLSLTPILKLSILLSVLGNNIDAAKINPHVISMMMVNISMAP